MDRHDALRDDIDRLAEWGRVRPEVFAAAWFEERGRRGSRRTMIGLGFVGDPDEGLAIARKVLAHPDAVAVRRCRFSATQVREFQCEVLQSMPAAPPGTTVGGVETNYRTGMVTVLLSSLDRDFGESIRNRWGADRVDIAYGRSVVAG